MHTSKQHFVPRMILKNFAYEKKRTWAYRSNDDKIVPTNINDLCCKNDLYETRWKEGTVQGETFVLDNKLEKMFSEEESKMTDIIGGILIDVENGKVNLSDNDKRDLLKFFAGLLLRNIYLLDDEMKAYEGVEKEEALKGCIEIAKWILQEKGLGDLSSWLEQNIKISMFNEEIENSPLSIELSNLEKRKMYFWRSSEEIFITSCFPIIIDGLGEGRNDRVAIPISPKCVCVFMDPNLWIGEEGDVIDVDKKNAMCLNESFLKNMKMDNMKLISKNKEELERLKKLYNKSK